MSCNPLDVSLKAPTSPSGPPIPGFGTPFILNLPNNIKFDLVANGLPEDLLDIFNKFQFLLPSGVLKPSLNPNFGKDIFDGIMKMLDQFFPFLMLYKFFMPFLNIVICIIEVLCAIPNPFKLIAAMSKLFGQCIPAFLALFPIFALIIMIISLLLLLVALVKYIVDQIQKFVNALLRNINALVKAIQDASSTAVNAIARKIGTLLCMFQNFFVLLSLFSLVLGVIRDLASTVSSIPPCDNSNSGADGCCTTDVCPAIVKTQYTRTTGTLKYLPKVGVPTSSTLPPPYDQISTEIRPESWQLFDLNQEIAEKFSNIYDAYDVTIIPKPIFYPTDGSYNASTPAKQAPYTIDLRFKYNPVSWGRAGVTRYVQFKDCVVYKTPTSQLSLFDNSTETVNNGVLSITGGLGYEDDGYTILYGYGNDGVTPLAVQATLNSFLHTKETVTSSPAFSSSDGYVYSNMEYIFKPNLPVLLSKNLVTLGCEPSLNAIKTFTNTAFAGDVAAKTGELNDLLNGANGNTFPDPAAAQECLSTALTNLSSNLTAEGVAEFQALCVACLSKLEADSKSALTKAIGIGHEPCNSSLAISPELQFTSKPIEIKVDLRERNNLSLTSGLPSDVGADLSKSIKAYATFGDVSDFTYDGYQYFVGYLTSNAPGSGELMVSFDNNIFCTNTIPADLTTQSPTHELKKMEYQFIYAPVGGAGAGAGAGSGSGDDTNKPRRDISDLGKENS